MEAVFLILGILLSWMVGSYAKGKGRSFWGYFFLSFLISPLLSFLLVAILGDSEDGQLAKGTIRKCPFCAEMVKAEAAVCKHCGKDLPPPQPAEALPSHPVPDTDRDLNVMDLLHKYEITFKGKYYFWRGDQYDSYKEPLALAQTEASQEQSS